MMPRRVALQVIAGHTGSISQHRPAEAEQAQRKSLGWKGTPGTTAVRGVRVGAKRTEKMNKGKIMKRRAATLRKHLNSEIRKKEIDDEMKRSKSWEQSQGCGPGRQGWRDIQEEMGVVVRCYGEKTKISASSPIHQ